MEMMKRFSIVLLIVICIFSIMLVKPTNAYDVGNVIGNMTGDAEIKDTAAIDDFRNAGNKILTFLQILSGIAAVVMIAVTGFRYIIETPEVKGELKKNMLPIVVGIVLVFFAASIAKFFLGMFQNSAS